MRTARIAPLIFLTVFVLGLTGCSTTPGKNSTAEQLPRIVVNKFGTAFQETRSGAPFTPWGMNYGNKGRLMEDFWQEDWETLRTDLHELKGLGANIVRVHLQFGKFMKGPNEPNQEALNLFKKLLDDCVKAQIYADVTGLACYRPEDTPAWYDKLEEEARWNAQANFWKRVSEVGSKSTAVFCYDLINEPISPGQKRDAEKWRSGSLFGGFDFLQYIALDPKGRSRDEIAVQWIRQMRAAIRTYDKEALITVGLLPWSKQWKHLSGFLPESVGPELDFISVHIYPDKSKLEEAMECLEKFAIGKPVVIEETFPLSCSTQELEDFMRASKKYASGWIGHYDGDTIEKLNDLESQEKLNIGQSIYREWLRLFVRLRPEFVREQ